MRLAIFGGRLQGIEATYLSSKAGYETVLADIDRNAPAKGLADEFLQFDILKNIGQTREVIRKADAVLPANENKQSLALLEGICNELGVPFMQDNAAFWVTSDKLRSHEFFVKSNIPTPNLWPKCGFPVIVKPSTGSGSESVHQANNALQLEKATEAVRSIGAEPVIQEFIQGPALSLEVVSRRGSGTPLQITGLEFDETYGCKRVYAPVELSEETNEKMCRIGGRIASELKLNGLTDVQSLVKGSNLKVNEINARLPSQTPTVVYHSTGINIVELLVKLFVEDRLEQIQARPNRAVLFQHVKIFENELSVQGEHVLTNARDLRAEKNFLGADEAITNLSSDMTSADGVATLIVVSQSLSSARKKMVSVVEKIMNEFALERYRDPRPRRGKMG